MLPPHELENRRFSKSAFGYKCDEVDEFVALVVDEYTKLYRENSDMAKKINVILDKLEEYRADEDNLRTALLNAQKLSDNIVRDAKVRADAIIADANFKADKIFEAAKARCAQEDERLHVLEQEVSSFRSRMLEIIHQGTEAFEALPVFTREVPAAPPQPEPAPEPEPAPSPSEPEPVPADEPEEIAEAEEEEIPLPTAGFDALPDSGLQDALLQDNGFHVSISFDEDLPAGSLNKSLKFGDEYDVIRDKGKQERSSLTRIFKKSKD